MATGFYGQMCLERLVDVFGCGILVQSFEKINISPRYTSPDFILEIKALENIFLEQSPCTASKKEKPHIKCKRLMSCCAELSHPFVSNFLQPHEL